MLWAACCLCYSEFLRSCEVTVLLEAAYGGEAHLNGDNVAVNDLANPTVILTGVDTNVGHTQNTLCPMELSGKKDQRQAIFGS